MLDDYAFTTIACLDAYEATADLTYFNFAHRIAESLIERFYDPEGGGFFDAEMRDGFGLGALSARRKPFQDSPTPAGNSMAAIALLRLHSYTGDAGVREKAEKTLQTFAGVAERYGIFAATYAIAVTRLHEPEVKVVVIGSDEVARELCRIALAPFAFNKAVLCFAENEVAAANLPPALAKTLPNIPRNGGSIALVCSGFSCLPPCGTGQELRQTLDTALRAA
jgi:uncharacterized protein YyaL (SSP411 family)